MQALQGLLFDAFDLYRDDVGAANRFKQSSRIGRIGLVALDVGPHIPRRQQQHLDPLLLQDAGPVMRRAAGLHDHATDRAIVKPAFELASRQAGPLDDSALAIGNGQLKDVLCQIHRNSRSIHLRTPFGLR